MGRGRLSFRGQSCGCLKPPPTAENRCQRTPSRPLACFFQQEPARPERIWLVESRTPAPRPGVQRYRGERNYCRAAPILGRCHRGKPRSSYMNFLRSTARRTDPAGGSATPAEQQNLKRRGWKPSINTAGTTTRGRSPPGLAHSPTDKMLLRRAPGGSYPANPTPRDLAAHRTGEQQAALIFKLLDQNRPVRQTGRHAGTDLPTDSDKLYFPPRRPRFPAHHQSRNAGANLKDLKASESRMSTGAPDIKVDIRVAFSNQNRASP